MSAPKPLVVYLFCMDLVGPQNACIGIGQALKARGHRVYFLTRKQDADRFRKHGIECFELVDETKPSEDAIKDFSKAILELGLLDDVSPMEKILKMASNVVFMDNERDQCIGFEPQIRAIVSKHRPDVVIVDAEIEPPSLICQQDFPYVHLFCSNPLGLFDHQDLPPISSGKLSNKLCSLIDQQQPLGLPTDPSFRPQWDEHRKVLHNGFHQTHLRQKEICAKFGCPRREEPLAHRVLSPYLNLYQFPAELDYDQLVQLPSSYLRVDAFVRDDPTPYQLPPEFENKVRSSGGKLIYVSMGSMGSFDFRLMKSLVATLSKTPHWYIVSKGKLADEYELGENMIGEAFLPQTRILSLPNLSAVITHGGNNSVTESLYFGRPVVVIPLFYDQYDNATVSMIIANYQHQQ